MKYTGEIDGQYGSREDKKIVLIQELPVNLGSWSPYHRARLKNHCQVAMTPAK
jgi:hypothetical protein